MRRLIHVPIIHTSSDLGSLSGPVRERYLSRVGTAGWDHRERTVAGLWKGVREDIERLQVDFRRVRIYQDGLPVCGFEEKIVAELADAGSLNHQLVLDLVTQGAALMGTEDPRLLIQEYEMQKRRHPAQPVSEATLVERPQEARRLLEARDRFIVRRIDETLLSGEIGLLFLGAAHPLEELRATNLLVETLGEEAAGAGPDAKQSRPVRR